MKCDSCSPHAERCSARAQPAGVGPARAPRHLADKPHDHPPQPTTPIAGIGRGSSAQTGCARARSVTLKRMRAVLDSGSGCRNQPLGGGRVYDAQSARRWGSALLRSAREYCAVDTGLARLGARFKPTSRIHCRIRHPRGFSSRARFISRTAAASSARSPGKRSDTSYDSVGS